MAYDPNDPADKAILDAAVAEALEQAATAHESDIDRLKAKNVELLAKLSKARKDGGTDSAGEIERLERELEELGGKLSTSLTEARDIKRQLATAEKDRDSAKSALTSESEFSRTMIVESSLTSSLAEANVAPQFLEAAKALLGKGVAVKEVDGERKAFVGDKSLGDYVKEWATGDAGKAFVKAPANGGGGASSIPNGDVTGKKMAELSEGERITLARTNPTLWNQMLTEANLQPTA